MKDVNLDPGESHRREREREMFASKIKITV
jgi:hypothetical protein